MAPIKQKTRTISQKMELEEMVCRYQESLDPDLMLEIVKRSENLVYKTVSGFRGRGIEAADLVQIGFTGLLRAVNRFDRHQDNKFSTYAVHCIRWEVLHCFRDQSLVKYPRWVFQAGRTIAVQTKVFEEKNGRSPTRQEIAESMGMTLSEIEEVLTAQDSLLHKESLDDAQRQEDIRLQAELSRSRQIMNFSLGVEDKVVLWHAIDQLSHLHKKVLISKLIVGKTQQEIGKDIGLSQKSVSKVFNESISMLRKEILH